ncbi:hypothetical protein LWI29_016187 [Acer saccharum]|uniref:Uncharacterized protein n=1 Tax=Acer saccharum TaxID=4024 RepID=A0AA39VHP4_ACESA|nr:hypothetical protein LWI29_016187 [Acer saccharum]
MEGTGSKNIVHELPPNPFTSLSNKNRGIAPACEVCPTTDFERAVALGGQDLENANDKKLKSGRGCDNQTMSSPRQRQGVGRLVGEVEKKAARSRNGVCSLLVKW